MGTDPKQLLGTTLSGRYRIDKAIGEGGMGAIFQATQLSLGRAVAIKVVKCVHDDNSDAVRRFDLETKVIASLAHPNIVQVVDAGTADDGTLYLAMELLQGDSVRQLLRKLGALPVGRVLAIVEDIASALSAAHAGGVIHRDLKAENVMLVKAAGKQEIAKVLDFGVAKLTTKTEAPPQTGSGFVAGTPGCIAPEQMLGKSDDPRSDLYSVGVLMFEMLAGEPPFVSSSSVELMMRHLTEPPPRVAEVAKTLGRAEVPAPVDELVASLLSKDPEKRPSSAEALVEIVSSLRDASRATQGDNRLPTPMGGFTVPTPGSVSMPTVSGATPIPFGAPSGAAIAPKPVTAPTTTVPVPAGTTDLVPRATPVRKKLLRAAAAVLVCFVLPGFAMWVHEMIADRAIPGHPWLERESWRHWNRIDDALLELDLGTVKQNARFILHEKQQDVPMAWLYLAHAAILERQPLSVVDGFHAQARASAERRAKSMGRSRHTQLMVDALTESDAEKARSKWLHHLEVGGCADAWVEEHMFAQRQTQTEVDGQKIVDTFTPLLARYRSHAFPLAKIGLARGLTLLGRLDEAEEIVSPLHQTRPLNVPILDAMIDIDLASGRSDEAIARIDKHLADGDDAHLAMRRAVILLRVRDDPRGVNGIRQRLEAVPDANPMKTLALGYLGHVLASRGQLTEANELWQLSKASALGPDAPMRIAETAVFASTFAAVIGDYELARRWLDEYQAVRDGMPEGPGTRRAKAVALGTRIMIAGESMRMTGAGASAARDYQWLRAESVDIPLLTQAIDWHAHAAQGKLDEAQAIAERLPACWKDGYLGMTAVFQRDLAKAVEPLQRATSKETQLECTSNDDVVELIQAVQLAKALGYLATVSCLQGDRAAAAGAIDRLRSYWPRPSSPSKNPDWMRYVHAVEGWLASPVGSPVSMCIPNGLSDAEQYELETAKPPARP